MQKLQTLELGLRGHGRIMISIRYIRYNPEFLSRDNLSEFLPFHGIRLMMLTRWEDRGQLLIQSNSYSIDSEHKYSSTPVLQYSFWGIRFSKAHIRPATHQMKILVDTFWHYTGCTIKPCRRFTVNGKRYMVDGERYTVYGIPRIAYHTSSSTHILSGKEYSSEELSFLLEVAILQVMMSS